jgi:hypothetical protein
VTKFLIALIISASLWLCGAATEASAKAPKAPPPSPALEALAACRAIGDNAARLACYDQASARFADAVTKGEVIVMDKQEVRQTRRSLFGFALPKIALFRGDEGGEAEQDEIEAVIISASGLGYDKYRMRIEDAVWETTEAAPFINPPRAGQKVVIKRGALGNYFIRIDGQKAVRGRRVG